jgi:UDP-N-acetylmuramate--alanine ligase
MVVEACEYRDSFLNLYPFIGVITNIDNDHLDYFGSIENIQKSFAKFVDRIPRNGFLICPAKDKIVSQVIKRARCKIIDYEKTPINFHLEIPGEHNIKNANAALAVSDIVGVERKIAISALKKFKGTWRRAEYKGTVSDGAIMYDDYAHHPTEIKTTLAGFRDKFKNKNITVIFQPHLYSRTKLLLNDFAKSFGDADNVIVAPIYAAREKTDPSISNEKRADAVALANFETIEDHIKNSIRKDDMIITMGAGDVFKIGEALVK